MAFEYKQEMIDDALSYSAYRKDINDMLAQPAANADAEKLRPYTRDNATIMERYDETSKVSKELLSALQDAPATTWLVITEGWCGDAAFNIPMMAAIESASQGKVKLRLVLRDSNPALMDAHLTDGGKSIPIVIVLDEQLQKRGIWGPRPQPLQHLMKQWKSEGLGIKELIPMVRTWYDADGTLTLQQELIEMIRSYSVK